MCPNEAYNTLLFMQIAILLHDLQLHLIIINVYTGNYIEAVYNLLRMSIWIVRKSPSSRWSRAQTPSIISKVFIRISIH